jgi:hypothetical protein
LAFPNVLIAESQFPCREVFTDAYSATHPPYQWHRKEKVMGGFSAPLYDDSSVNTSDGQEACPECGVV